MAATAFHRSVPLHHQVQQFLRASIEAGDIAPDEQMPTEVALVERFKVSRATIRAAMSALERDGLISRHRGRGTFVRETGDVVRTKIRITHPLLGYEADVRLVKTERMAAPAHVVPFLGVKRGEPIKRFVRVEMVDEEPLAVVVNYVAMELGRRIPARALRRHTMLDVLSKRLGIPFGSMRQVIEARLPDHEVASLLVIAPTQPVLHVRLLLSDTAARPVEISDTFYRADRYRYELDTPGLQHARGQARTASLSARDRRAAAR